ncbi:hypothetical protein DITRI_Ditri10aG0176900 [Diplodiscus trichospermus]
MLQHETETKPWISMLNDCTRYGRHYEALSLFIQKVRCSSCFGLDHRVLAAVIKSCAAVRTTVLGRALHNCVVKLGHFSCHTVSKALLNMYAKSGALRDCQKLFGQMPASDPVVWNIVLSGLSGYREYNNQVLDLFNSMRVSNEAKPTPVTVAIVLPLYARLGDIDGGKIVHSYVIKSGLEVHTLVGNALISMYAKCGRVKPDAYATFCSIGDKDVVSWNAIIAGFSENNFMDDALRLFREMLKGPIAPNDSTIVNILPVCSSFAKDVACYLGKEIHCFLLRTGMGADVSVCNALLSFYLRVGPMDKAELMFQKMESRDLVSWNAIIAGYVAIGDWLGALYLFQELLSAKMFEPNSVTLVSILSACAHLKDLRVGKVIHGYILQHSCFHADTRVANALVSFYAKCDNRGAAYQTFLMIPRRDMVSWNSILDAFADCEYDDRFQEHLNCMFEEGFRPDFITILAIIRFCVRVSSLAKVKETHSYCLKAGMLLGDSELAIINAIIDAYAKSGKMEYASRIFQRLSGRRNLVTFNSILSGYVNCGSYNDAVMIFNGMPVRDLTSWNLMVQACAENDCPGQALSVFHKLQAQGMKPDAVSVISILPVCAHMVSVYLLRQCHGYAIRACYQDARLNGALLDVYAKCGSIWSAHKLFHLTPVKDLVMFTSIIGGYAMHGMGKEALCLFYYMLELGLKPDHVIITAILSSCSHAGLVDEGLKIFYSLETAHGMKPSIEHYACIVDLLARGGRINDAYSLAAGMPVETNANVWGALLGACRKHQEVELGRAVADHLFQVEASNIGNYVVMSNLYAADARWDSVKEVRKLMRSRDMKKPAGCSWIEVEKRNNVFIAGDCFHPKREIIYTTLTTLDKQIKEPLLFDKINKFMFTYGI